MTMIVIIQLEQSEEHRRRLEIYKSFLNLKRCSVNLCAARTGRRSSSGWDEDEGGGAGG